MKCDEEGMVVVVRGGAGPPGEGVVGKIAHRKVRLGNHCGVAVRLGGGVIGSLCDGVIFGGKVQWKVWLGNHFGVPIGGVGWGT